MEGAAGLGHQVFSDLHLLLEQAPQLKRQVVQVAAQAYRTTTLDPTVEARQQFGSIFILRHAASVLLTNVLQPEVWQYEASASQPGSLLYKAAELARCPLLHSTGEINTGSVLPLAYHMAASLAHSLKQCNGAGAAQEAMRQRVIHQLGASILPALCQSAAQVAAAGPGRTGGSPGAAAAAEPASQTAAATVARGAAPLCASFGELCWGDLGTEWAFMLRAWTGTAIDLQGVNLAQLLTTSEQRAGAAAAVQALLRLAPLLPQQPVGDSSHGQSECLITAAAAVAGTNVLLEQASQTRHPTAAALQVLHSASLAPLANCILRASVQGPASKAEAMAAFHAFSTVCRYVHLLTSQLAGDGTSTGSAAAAAGTSGCPPAALLFFDPILCNEHSPVLLITAMMRVVAVHQYQAPLAHAAGDGPDDGNARLEAAQG
jgi:hypothetical protein